MLQPKHSAPAITAAHDRWPEPMATADVPICPNITLLAWMSQMERAQTVAPAYTKTMHAHRNRREGARSTNEIGPWGSQDCAQQLRYSHVRRPTCAHTHAHTHTHTHHVAVMGVAQRWRQAVAAGPLLDLRASSGECNSSGCRADCERRTQRRWQRRQGGKRGGGGGGGGGQGG